MGFKQKLTSMGELPWRHSVVNIRDGTELCAENCTEVVGCTDLTDAGEVILKIRCNGADRLMRVCGEKLALDSFGPYGVRILGKIPSVSFIEL